MEFNHSIKQSLRSRGGRTARNVHIGWRSTLDGTKVCKDRCSRDESERWSVLTIATPHKGVRLPHSRKKSSKSPILEGSTTDQPRRIHVLDGNLLGSASGRKPSSTREPSRPSHNHDIRLPSRILVPSRSHMLSTATREAAPDMPDFFLLRSGAKPHRKSWTT